MVDIQVEGITYTVSEPMPEPSLRLIKLGDDTVGYIGRWGDQHRLFKADLTPAKVHQPIASTDGVAKIGRALHCELGSE